MRLLLRFSSAPHLMMSKIRNIGEDALFRRAAEVLGTDIKKRPNDNLPSRPESQPKLTSVLIRHLLDSEETNSEAPAVETSKRPTIPRPVLGTTCDSRCYWSGLKPDAATIGAQSALAVA